MKANPKLTKAQVVRSVDHHRHRQVARALQATRVPAIETLVTRSQFKILADRRLNTIEGQGVAAQVGITRVVTQDPVQGIIAVKHSSTRRYRSPSPFPFLSIFFRVVFISTMIFIQILHE